MNKKLAVAATVIGLVGSFNISEAAHDPLWSPAEGPYAPISTEQEPMTVVVPNEEVRAMAQTYAAWYEKQVPLVYKVNNRIVGGVDVSDELFLYYMRVRLRFYRESHNWPKDSYGRNVLEDMYKDYVAYFQDQAKRAVRSTQLADDILRIEEKHAYLVYNNELRSYINEAVLFSMREAMYDRNRTRKVLPQPPVVDSKSPVDLRSSVAAAKEEAGNAWDAANGIAPVPVKAEPAAAVAVTPAEANDETLTPPAAEPTPSKGPVDLRKAVADAKAAVDAAWAAKTAPVKDSAKEAVATTDPNEQRPVEP